VARRSRRYTVTSITHRQRLSGISHKSGAATMDGDTTKNHSRDDAFTVSVEAPIHVVQITTGRGLLGPGIGAASRRPAPRVTEPTPGGSRKARTTRTATSTGREQAAFSHHRQEEVDAEAGQLPVRTISTGDYRAVHPRPAPPTRTMKKAHPRRVYMTGDCRKTDQLRRGGTVRTVGLRTGRGSCRALA